MVSRVKPLIRKGRFLPESENKTFCMAPFTHTYISPQSERRMCCASREEASFVRQYIDGGTGENSSISYSPRTLEEHWNSEHMRRVRRDLLEGKTIPECEVCNNQILNLGTYRSWFNSIFADKVDEVFAATDETGHLSLPVVSFDYRLNNLCNFKCRMCGHQLSSSWEAELRTHDAWSPIYDPWMIPETKKQIEAFHTNVVTMELEEACKKGIVEEIYWVGGEPLMWEKHWELMHHMVQSGHANKVFVRYNTNLSRINWKGINLFRDLLPHYRYYQMCCSIDATGRIGEFIRTGLVWEEWLANFKEGLAVPGQKDAMKLDLTLTLPGMFDLVKFHALAVELDVEILSKLVYAFSPDKLVSPLALPRHVLEPLLDDIISKIEPNATPKTASLISLLHDVRSRPTFEEQWPDKFQDSFYKGRQFFKDLAHRRGDGKNGKISIEEIFESDPAVLRWWMQN